MYRVDGSTHKQWFLTEDGLYEVLMQSRKPIAKQFKKEVKQILKQIRRTGDYVPVNVSLQTGLNNVLRNTDLLKMLTILVLLKK